MKQAWGNTAQNIFLHALLPRRGCDVDAILSLPFFFFFLILRRRHSFYKQGWGCKSFRILEKLLLWTQGLFRLRLSDHVFYKWRLHYSPNGKGAQLIKPWNISQLMMCHSIPELLLISQGCDTHRSPASVGFHWSQLLFKVSCSELQFPIDTVQTFPMPRRENGCSKGWISLKICSRNG